MIQKRIEELQLGDIQSLIDNGVPESKTLEYKSEIKIDKDADKKEFLYDVSSFANALGGDIIYGISEGEEKGLPDAINGINENMDELSRRVESMIRDSITPRILNIKIKPISVNENSSVLVIHIPRSANAPH